MEKYISKAAVVAELEDWRDKIKKGIFSIPLTGSDRAYATFEYEILGKVRDFLDTLEVKEVDLDKEVTSYILDNTRDGYFRADIHDVAEHFYELGLKAQKGE